MIFRSFSHLSTLIAAIILLTLVSLHCNRQPESLAINGSTMGTFYSVRISFTENDNNPGYTSSALKEKIDSLLLEVNRQMSTYINTSEISQFNRYQDTTYFSVSSDFAYVVSKSLEVSNISGGAFDITIGALVDIWGFGAKGRITHAPPRDSINKMLEQIGYNKLHVQLDPPALKKSEPHIQINLGAIAKGFGVDKVAEYLSLIGYSNYLVEIGGEIRVSGTNQHREAWKIGIAAPNSQGEIQKIVSLSNNALATSGDYHNYFEENGKRYSHTIDPTTGYPITHNLASVTVIAETCAFADAFATALDVVGPDEGIRIAEEWNIPVFMIIYSDNGFQERSNESFRKFFTEEKKPS